MNNFEYRHGELHCEDVPVSRIDPIAKSEYSVFPSAVLIAVRSSPRRWVPGIGLSLCIRDDETYNGRPVR